jgi:O-antigen/teichoic acid export membrane protein
VANGAAGILSASAYSVVPASSWLSRREDATGLRALLDRGTRFSVSVTLPVVILAAIVSGPALRLWVGSDAAQTATLIALLTIALVAPLQVGSELLVGTGRAGRVVRAAGASLVVNLIATVVLVHVVGVSGTFLGTVVAELVLIPLLATAFLSAVGETASGFARAAILQLLGPLVALLSVGLVVSRLPVPDAIDVALSASAGLAAYGAMLAVSQRRRGEPIPRLRQLLSER